MVRGNVGLRPAGLLATIDFEFVKEAYGFWTGSPEANLINSLKGFLKETYRFWTGSP